MMLVLLYLALGANQSVSIKVKPSQVFIGDTIAITCTVERKPENRKVTAWLIDGEIPVDISEWPVDGDKDGKIFAFSKKPSCDTNEAACAVVDSSNHMERAMMRVNVVGCDSGKHKWKK